MDKVYEFTELSLQEQEPVRELYKGIQKLIDFSDKVTCKLLVYLYGEKLGNHLWDKYISYDRDIISWYLQLSIENKGLLASNLYYNEVMYAHC